MSRFMPASNLPVREAHAGDMYGDFPDVSQLRRGEWEVHFQDFAEGTGIGAHITGSDPPLADYFTASAHWVPTGQGTQTDVADILAADAHTLAICKTDATEGEGYEIQNISQQVFAKPNRTILFEALIGVEDISDVDCFIGINEVDTDIIHATTGVVSLNNGAGFRILFTEGTSTWACIHGGATGGTVDAGDAGTGADATVASGLLTNFVRLGVKIVGGTTPTISWYYNGALVQSDTATTFDKLSVPTFIVLAGAGADAENLWIDYYMLAQTRTVA